ncbi:MAG: hypothetical protein WAN65_05580 [Candidatus Sulfotelmatobacter sp.]
MSATAESIKALPTLEKAEAAVLASLRNGTPEISPRDLVAKVARASLGITEIDVRRAIWRLISGGEVRLSPRQRLSAARRDEEAAA